MYFDAIKFLANVIAKSDLAVEYKGEGYYSSDSDYDTTNPFFSRPIYHWYASNNDNANVIRNKWNVVFAGHCWQMIRTTDTGGVKLLYNGLPDIGEDGNGNRTYNCSDERANKNAGIGTRSSTSFNGSYYYGTGYTYDRSTGTFSLTGVGELPST